MPLSPARASRDEVGDGPTPEHDAFRREVREFCAAASVELDDPSASRGLKGGYSQAFQRAMAARGWIGLQLPRRYGGQEKDWIHETILAEELGRAGVPAGKYAGTALEFGHLILRFGTEEQREHFLPRIVRGEISAGHAYTEPEAGSDLSSIRTRAVLEGDHYVITGQKMFASEVHHSDHTVLSARTDEGVTMFILDSHAPGMSHTRLGTLGGKGTNHLFLDGVRIHRDRVLGAPGKGWEQFLAIRPEYWVKNQGYLIGGLQRGLDTLAAQVRARSDLAGDPLVRHRIAELAVKVGAVRAATYRLASALSRGDPDTDALTAMVKVITDETILTVGDGTISVLGPVGLLGRGAEHAVASGAFENVYRENALKHFSSLGHSFIRNEVAALRLGMPDPSAQLPREDRDLTDEQRMLRRSARSLFARERHDRLWAAMGDLGWHAWMLPRTYGGGGGSFIDAVVILEEIGRALAPVPFFASTVLAGLCVAEAGTEEQKRALIPAVARGEIFTLAATEPGSRHETDAIRTTAVERGGGLVLRGEKILVADAAAARHVVTVARTTRGLALPVVEMPDPSVRVSVLRTLANAGEHALTLDGVAVPAERVLGGPGDRAPEIDRALAKARVAFCAQLVGAMERVLEMTVDHARTRVQHGRPLAAVQVLQHRCADVAIALEAARALTHDAARRIDRGAALEPHASIAKAFTGEAYRLSTWVAMQIHGGAGFLADHPLGRYYVHAKSAELTLGGPDVMRDRVAAALLGSAP